MYSYNHYRGIDPRFISIANKKAKALIKDGLFSEYELEDLQQELISHLTIQLRHYRPVEAALLSYTKKVIRKQANKLILNRSRKKRGADISIYSLCEYVAQEESQALIDFISEEAGFDECAVAGLAMEIEFETNLRLFINSLPADLKHLYALLQTMGVEDIANHTGKSLSTVYRLRETLQKMLIDSGFIHKRRRVRKSRK